MYSYTYDTETGGILLNSSPTVFSKEPRPVYSSEMDILGFDRFFKYAIRYRSLDHNLQPQPLMEDHENRENPKPHQHTHPT